MVDVGATKNEKASNYNVFCFSSRKQVTHPKSSAPLIGIILKPIPVLLKSVHAWIPASTGVITTHALSGATTSVVAESNAISLKVGDSLNYEFKASPYSAQSFKVEGSYLLD